MGLFKLTDNDEVDYYASINNNPIQIFKYNFRDYENNVDKWAWKIIATISKWKTKDLYWGNKDPYENIAFEIEYESFPTSFDLLKTIYDEFKTTIDKYEDDDPLENPRNLNNTAISPVPVDDPEAV